jgi:hypothetical protein
MPPAGEITNSKLQITNKEVPFGHIINASGDKEGSWEVRKLGKEKL